MYDEQTNISCSHKCMMYKQIEADHVNAEYANIRWTRKYTLNTQLYAIHANKRWKPIYTLNNEYTLNI